MAKDEREICGLRNEGHEMNGDRRPSGVCPGGYMQLHQGEEQAAAAVTVAGLQSTKEKSSDG